VTVTHLAYLTTPAPDRFVLNIQVTRTSELLRYEITKAHLINILVEGAAMAFREQYPTRVPNNSTQESADNERART
jgi:hypothetical protein